MGPMVTERQGLSPGVPRFRLSGGAEAGRTCLSVGGSGLGVGPPKKAPLPRRSPRREQALQGAEGHLRQDGEHRYKNGAAEHDVLPPGGLAINDEPAEAAY